MKVKNKSKGFTLIEVITTILIIAIILTIAGTSIINTITKSKNESTKITMNNILNSARIYTKEYSKDISWKKKDGENTKFSCISINELISKDLLKKDIKEKYPNTKYIIIKKDENNNIISEEIDDGTCSNSIKSITIPTSKNFCNNLTYDGSPLQLTKSYQDTGFIFNLDDDNDLTNYTIDVINAGTYTIVAKLEDKNQYQWTDGTTSDKKFSCTIKKATPTITLDSSGITPANITIGETINVKVTSNTNGTLILKSSNNDYYEPSITDNNITAYTTDKEFNIKFLSTRNVKGSITITLIPKDKKNYNNSSTVYSIGAPTKHSIPIPTAETYCENKDYNGNTQNLIKNNAIQDGITLYNYEATAIGVHTVEAKLKFGYIWEDNTTETKTFECEIKRPTFQVCYDANGGTSTMECDSITYGDYYTIKENKFSYEGHTFTNWNTNRNGSGTILYPNNKKVYNYLENTTLYAQWLQDSYNINYNLNGGIINPPAPTKANYNEIIHIPRPTKIYTITYNNNSTGATIDKKNEQINNYFEGWTAINLNIDTANIGNSRNDVTQSWKDYTFKTYFKNLGSSGTTVTLIASWTNFSTTLPQITKEGYTCNWNTRSDGNGTIYNQGSSYTPTSDVTLYATCNANKVNITYNPNVGTVTANTDAGSWTVVNDLIYLNGNLHKTTVSYGTKMGDDGLNNYNNSDYLNITKTGYKAISGAEWICLKGCSTPNKTFDHSKAYSHDDFCDASNDDCTVVLGVNWIKTEDNINGIRYSCQKYNNESFNRLSVFYITTCNTTYCNYSKINGLTSSTIDNNMIVFTPTWTIQRNLLGSAIGNSACKTTTWYVNSSNGVYCRSGASKETNRVTSIANCTGIPVSRTTTKINEKHNWFYFPSENCYIYGEYLSSSNTCTGGSGNISTDPKPLMCGKCNSDSDCGSDMTCNSNCGAGYSCCVKKVNQSTGIMCN